MRKLNKLMTLLIVLTLILSTASMSFAQGMNESDIKTGFYIVDDAGNNIFIDIYTYLNNKEEYLPIINQGLKNVLFVNQDKEGATLEEFLGEATFRELVLEDFEESYKDGRTDKDLKPRDAFYSFTASLDKAEYNLDDEITLIGRVLKLEQGLSEIDITFKIEKDGDLVSIGQFETDDNGEFEHTFKVPADLEAGTYSLTVKANEPVDRTVNLDLVIVDPELQLIEEVIESVLEDIEGVVWGDENDPYAVLVAGIDAKTLEIKIQDNTVKLSKVLFGEDGLTNQDILDRINNPESYSDEIKALVAAVENSGATDFQISGEKIAIADAENLALEIVEAIYAEVDGTPESMTLEDLNNVEIKVNLFVGDAQGVLTLKFVDET